MNNDKLIEDVMSCAQAVKLSLYQWLLSELSSISGLSSDDWSKELKASLTPHRVDYKDTQLLIKPIDWNIYKDKEPTDGAKLIVMAIWELSYLLRMKDNNGVVPSLKDAVYYTPSVSALQERLLSFLSK